MSSPFPPIGTKRTTNKTRKEDPRAKRFKHANTSSIEDAESVDTSSIKVNKSNLPMLFAESNRAYNSSNHHAKESNKHNEIAKEKARDAVKFRANRWSMQDFGEEEEYANVINPSAAMAPPQLPAKSFTEDTELPDISSLSIGTTKLPPIGNNPPPRGGKRKTRKSKKGTRKNNSRKHRRYSKK
jgi:hypothetical protein